VSRLPRFDGYRHIGVRDTMRFYDCEDPEEFEAIEARFEERDLLEEKLVQVFAPDTPTEARNRGFRPV
jgi:hypothetical protein